VSLNDSSSFTVRRQEGSQIAVGDTDDATMTMCDQVAVFYPSPDRTGGDAETFRHLGDREKLLIIAKAATVGGAESTSFLIAVAGGVSSGGHAGPPSGEGRHIAQCSRLNSAPARSRPW
jgi:hypothetical protein